ncbi:MAG: hypothetical protein ACKOA8_11170 [Deltaproteobacteria bacterium]|jgi:hypothetical protein
MFVNKSLKLALLVWVLGVFHSSVTIAKNEELAQNPLPAKNTTIITEPEFLKLQKSMDPQKLGDPSESQDLNHSSLYLYPVWYCVAQSYWSGNWYYWYSPDLNYSRYRALNACTFYNGYTCFVNCQIRY